MVDTHRRKRLALHMRHLSVGLMTNDEFEEAIMYDVSDGWLPEQYYRSPKAKSENDDPVIKPMLELCWGLYDDTRQHSLTKGDELNGEARKIIARCIVFLNTERKYEWPYLHTNNPLFRFSFIELILTILSLGIYCKSRRGDQIVSYNSWQQLGDFGVWPFFSNSDYNEELEKHPFLNGRREV